MRMILRERQSQLRAAAECSAVRWQNVLLDAMPMSSVLDRDMSLGEKVLATLSGTKGKHKAIYIDVLDKAKVQEAAGKTLANMGRSIFSSTVQEAIIRRRQQALKCLFSIFRLRQYNSFLISI